MTTEPLPADEQDDDAAVELLPLGSRPPGTDPAGAPPPLGPASDRFARMWLALDRSPLRPVWPFVLGTAIAGVSLVVWGSVLWAAVTTVVIVGAIGWMGRRVTLQLEELDRMSD